MSTNEAAERLREAIVKARRDGDDHICVTMDFLEAALSERSAGAAPLDVGPTEVAWACHTAGVDSGPILSLLWPAERDDR